MPRVLKSGGESCGDFVVSGELNKKLCEEKLPSNKDVLSRFIYSRSEGQKDVAGSVKECAFEVENIWKSANIPTQDHYRVQNKIKSLYSQWTGLKKNKSRDQTKNKVAFSKLLDKMFDIAYNNSIKTMKNDDKQRLGIEENLILVTDKLIERKEYWQKLMKPSVDVEDEASENTNITNRSDETYANDSTNECLLQQLPETENESNVSGSITNATSRQNQDNNDTDTESDTSSVSEAELEWISIATDNISLAVKEGDIDSSTDSDDDYIPPNTYRKKKSRKKKVIMTPQLSSALDRSNITDREAVYILIPAAISFGLNPGNMVINRESFRQSRQTNRKDKAAYIQEHFDPQTPLVLHWDGKLLPNAQLNKKVERVAVIVTGVGISQTLGIPYLSVSSGKNQADLVYDTVKKWRNVKDHIQFLSFDTTSLNSGRIKGTCLWLEKLFGKLLLIYSSSLSDVWSKLKID